MVKHEISQWPKGLICDITPKVSKTALFALLIQPKRHASFSLTFYYLMPLIRF